MQSSSNRKQLTGPAGLSGTQTLSERSLRCVAGPNLCTLSAQTLNCLCGLGAGYVMTRTAAFRGKSPGASQDRICAAWMHKQPGIALWPERFRQGQRGPAAFRLCNLVAQGPRDTEEKVERGSREGTDWARNRSVGDSFLQTASRGGGIRGRANLGRALSSDRHMRGSADANRLDGIVKTNL